MPAFDAMPAFFVPARPRRGTSVPPAKAGGTDECGHITLGSRRKERGHFKV